MTLKDVAKAANLSVTQVSRALNNHDDVSEETKVRVRKIAKEIGYVKNQLARKLVMKDENDVALVLKGFEDESNMVSFNSVFPILHGTTKYTNEAKLDLVVHILKDDITSYLEYFSNKGIKRAILYGFEYDDVRLNEIYLSNMECVFIDIPINREGKGCVITNNMLYSTLAVESLISNGKKNIAMISGKEHAIVSIEREAGYKMALSKNKLEHLDILRANFDQSEAYDRTIEAMGLNPSIDAFFCASDYMAIGCMEALKSIGKKIPEDIAVFGFDDIPICSYISPSLSSVAQDDFKKGYEAAKLLHNLKNVGNNRTVMLDCKLVSRKSSNNI